MVRLFVNSDFSAFVGCKGTTKFHSPQENGWGQNNPKLQLTGSQQVVCLIDSLALHDAFPYARALI